MGAFTIAEQTLVQIIICFSLLNLAFILALQKEKAFSRLFGLSFVLPFVLGLLCIYYPDPGMRRILLPSIGLLFLFLLVVSTYIWLQRKHTYYGFLILISPMIALVILKYSSFLPPFFYSRAVLSAITILITVVSVYIIRKKVKETESLLMWGMIILGAIQTFYTLVSAQSDSQYIFLIAAGEFIAYLLFFMYIIRKCRDPYLARVRKAEAKVADLKKTIGYEVKKRLIEVERHNEHLLNMVQKDPLVEAYNKKGIMNILEDMVHDPQKDKFTMMLFDIDNFKQINDTQGHVAGDHILKKVANMARENIRGFDMLGRYGGDEFIIVLPGTTLTDAMFVADRFRKRVSRERTISVSIGVAVFPDDGDTVKKLIEVADEGLYRSKRAGKNAVSYKHNTIS